MTQQTQIILLDDLRERCGGRAKTMIRVLESFIASHDQYVDRLKQAQIQSDLQQLAKTLHSIKGILREIAVQDGASYVENLEQKLKQNSPIEAGELDQTIDWILAAESDARSAEKELRETLGKEQTN